MESLAVKQKRLRKMVRARGGFTLVEMLVVLLIMGLFVGLVSTITRPDERALLRLEAERLAHLLDLAAAESRLSGKSIAWTSDGASYRFWRFSEERGWSEVRDIDSLRERTLPQGMIISGLRVENTRSPGSMRLEFGPHSPARSFIVQISLGEERYAVEGSPVGHVRVLPGEGKTSGDVALR